MAKAGPDSLTPDIAMQEDKTRGERREEKRKKRRKMRVVGRSVRLLQDIIRRRAESIRRERD